MDVEGLLALNVILIRELYLLFSLQAQQLISVGLRWTIQHVTIVTSLTCFVEQKIQTLSCCVRLHIYRIVTNLTFRSRPQVSSMTLMTWLISWGRGLLCCSSSNFFGTFLLLQFAVPSHKATTACRIITKITKNVKLSHYWKWMALQKIWSKIG